MKLSIISNVKKNYPLYLDTTFYGVLRDNRDDEARNRSTMGMEVP